jgi:hypothetical protein
MRATVTLRVPVGRRLFGDGLRELKRQGQRSDLANNVSEVKGRSARSGVRSGLVRLVCVDLAQ